MFLATDLKERAEILDNADFQEVSGRLIHLLEWMEEQQPIAAIVEELRATGGAMELLQQANPNSPPKANTREQIAAVGLALIEACRDQDTDLWRVAFGTGIHARNANNNVSYHSDEALQRYIVPFLNYVLKRLPNQDPVPQSVPTFSADAPPIEIAHSLLRFRSDFPDPGKVGFLVMRFEDTPAHLSIQRAISETLAPHGVTAVRADGKRYHDDVLYNVLTYLHGCSFGIAIFERITRDDFNPNVSLEVGYLMAMRKPILLLKDQNLQALQTDLVGRIYDPFDFQNPIGSIPSLLERWLRDKGIIV